MVLISTLSMPTFVFPHQNLNENVSVTNIDASIPRSDIISQEVIYISEIPVVFESYNYNGLIVDIGSLLEVTPQGYRVVTCGEEINRPMPKNFMAEVLATHDEMRQLNQGYGTPTTRNSNGGHHSRESRSSSMLIAGNVVPGTLVEHWFSWNLRFTTPPISRSLDINSGGMRASTLQISPVESISLTENITVHSLTVSPSFPSGFGIGGSSHTRSLSISASNARFLSSSRGDFSNGWAFAPPGALVTIDTAAVSGIRVGHGVVFGHTASVNTPIW